MVESFYVMATLEFAFIGLEVEISIKIKGNSFFSNQSHLLVLSVEIKVGGPLTRASNYVFFFIVSI